MELSNLTIAFLLATFAGLSTVIGGLVVFYKKSKSDTFLGLSTAFAIGVMVCVSVVEMIPHSYETLGEHYGNTTGILLTVALLLGGMAFVALIERLVPSKEKKEAGKGKKPLFRSGLLVALAIAVHNFPEGIATFVGSLTDIEVGVMIAIAIAIHNIPEGIAIASPIYRATGSKGKAIGMTFLSGITEPIGALFAFLLLGEAASPLFFGYIMSFIAGIMIYISFWNLMPIALEYGKSKHMVIGSAAGLAVMGISLFLE